MLNWAISSDLEIARALKNLYKSVLDTLVSLIETGNWRELPSIVRNVHEGRMLTWTISDEAGRACGSCGCDRFLYEPEGEGLAFDFCPACWSMRGEERAGGRPFAVGKELEKRVRDLAPGMTLSLTLGCARIPLGPTRSTDAPLGKPETLEGY